MSRFDLHDAAAVAQLGLDLAVQELGDPCSAVKGVRSSCAAMATKVDLARSTARRASTLAASSSSS